MKYSHKKFVELKIIFDVMAKELQEEEYIEALSTIIKRDYFPDLLETEPDSNLTVDEFHEKYTSEDNVSFSLLMEETIKKQREKMSWMYQNSIEYQERKQLEQKALETWKPQPRLMLPPTIIKKRIVNAAATRFKSIITEPKTPIQVDEYGLVSMNPEIESEPATPMMTWGAIGTPIRIDETPLRYRVPETPRREEIINNRAKRPRTGDSNSCRN